MLYKLPRSQSTSRMLYALDRSGKGRDEGSDLYQVLNYIESAMMDMAVGVCTDQSDHGDKAYDRGFIKGIDAVLAFIIDSIQAGDDLIFKKDPDKMPRKW